MSVLEILLILLSTGSCAWALSAIKNAQKAQNERFELEAKLADREAELEHRRKEASIHKKQQEGNQQTLLTRSKLAQVAELTTDGACVCDAQGQVEWVNKAWEQTTGYSLKELRGKKPGQVLHGSETDQESVCKIREAMAAKRPVTVELLNYTKEGSKLWIRLLVKPIFDEKGSLTGFLGIQTDLTMKRLTQKRLERMHERAELALSAGNFGIWDWWPQPDRLEWDERCGLLYESREVTSDYASWMKLVHKADLPTLEAHLRAALMGKEQLKTEFRLQAKPERHLEIRGQVQRDEQGTPVRMTGLVRDITEELEIKDELRMTTERLRLSLKGANDGVWEWSLEEDRVSMDERWQQITGCHSEDLPCTRRDLERSLHPEDFPLFKTVLEGHLDGRTPYFEVECRVAHLNGAWVWVHWKGCVVRREESGHAMTLCGTYSDVSVKRRTDEALQRSSLLLRQMCQEMGIAAWEIEAEDFKLNWTEELDLLHHAPADFEPSLEHFLALYPSDSRKELSKALETALETGRDFDLEVRWKAPDSDKNLWYRWIGNPVRTEGRMTALCGLIHDVTAIHEAAAQRRELDAKLAELNQHQTLGTITDNLAHDLNAMLGSLQGFLELAKEESAPQSEQEHLLEKAQSLGSRTHDIIRQVLLMNRVRPAARISLSPIVLVEELGEQLTKELGERVQVVRNIDRRCPAIHGDAAQIQQALLLVGRQAATVLNQEPGKMEISLFTEEIGLEKAASLGMTLSGGCCCVEFRVTREKLEDAEWSQLFESAEKDPGLNLAAAKKILADHHGVLVLQHHPVHGGTCRAWLPLSETVQSMPASSAPIPEGAGESIWILDTERFVSNLAKTTLEKGGYQVRVFRAIEECQPLLEKESPALLIVGLGLGAQSMSQLQELRANGSLRSSFVGLGNAEHWTTLGECAYLPPPFTVPDLMRAVHCALHPVSSNGSLLQVPKP